MRELPTCEPDACHQSGPRLVCSSAVAVLRGAQVRVLNVRIVREALALAL